jgi:hypothetical protein
MTLTGFAPSPPTDNLWQFVTNCDNFIVNHEKILQKIWIL